ncbi:hypothetical protein FF1_020820 [Malus domestica]
MAPVGIRVLELTALPAFFLTEVVIIFAMGMSMASGYRCGCVMVMVKVVFRGPKIFPNLNNELVRRILRYT